MTDFRIREYASTAELRANAQAWDDLWQRSAVAAPSSRANLIGLWADHFARGKRFRALAVEHEGRLVAALPLVAHSLGRVVKVHSLPCNDWAASGDLLVDPAADSRVFDALAGALACSRRVLWLEQVAYTSAHWQSLLDACRRNQMSVNTAEHYRVAQVAIGHDWEAYEATRKGDHRRSRRRYSRLLEAAGPTALATYRPAGEQVDELMLRGFEVEDRSWKGSAGTSVLKTPGLIDFLCAEARQLAEWGQLQLSFLEHNGQAIAFAYNWHAKGSFFMPKLGYDDAFARFGPGQQLIMRLLEQLHGDPQTKLFDFWGPLVAWNESWATSTYPVGRVVIAGPHVLQRGFFHAYQNWRPRLRQLRARFRRPAPSAEPAGT